MRRAAVLVLGLVVSCSSSSTGGAGSDPCVSLRHAIERDKQAVQDNISDPPAADKARRDVEADARAARSVSGCDISDLVGDNVGS